MTNYNNYYALILSVSIYILLDSIQFVACYINFDDDLTILLCSYNIIADLLFVTLTAVHTHTDLPFHSQLY